MALDDRRPVIGGSEPPAEDLASVVLVERAEELAAVCGRVDTAPTWAVVINAPDGNRQLSTELGMRRLLHHAAEAGKVVAIATRSSSLASRARDLGVPVARRPEHIRWDAGGRRLVRVGRLNIAAPGIGRYVQVAFIAAVAFAGLFLLLALAPSASVTAYPPTETVSQVVTITAVEARTSIDFERFEVPASRVTTEQRFTLAMKTTGTTQVGVAPATVKLTISNGTGAAVAVAAGTVVTAGPEAFPFEIVEAVTVPPNGTAEASATARRPGAPGNVPAGAVTGWEAERYRFLKVTNAAPAAGGVSEPRPAVDSRDVVAIKALAKALETSDAVKARLLESRPHDAVFLGTAEGFADYDDAVPVTGTPAEFVTLDVTVKLSALAVLETTLNELARNVLAGAAPGGEFVPGTVRAVETGARQIDTETGLIRTELRLAGELARGVSADAIREAVKGKSKDDVRSTLSERYGIEDAEVRLSGWAPRFPRFGFRIDVDLAAREPLLEPGTATPNGTTAIATSDATPAAGTGPR